jgi:hypothetical protein
VTPRWLQRFRHPLRPSESRLAIRWRDCVQRSVLHRIVPSHVAAPLPRVTVFQGPGNECGADENRPPNCMACRPSLVETVPSRSTWSWIAGSQARGSQALHGVQAVQG